MSSLKALLFAALLFVTPASAQMSGGQMFPGPGTAHSTGGGGYTGPGDVVASARAWWGLRCYTNAYSGNVADLVDTATGNTTGTRLVCASGVVSALVSGSACTFVTGNACSATATTCATACQVVTLYDQTAGNNCTAATCDMTSSAAGQRPNYIQNCLGSLPCMQFVGASNMLLRTGTNLTSTSQPYTYSYVAIRTGTFTTFGPIYTDTNTSGGFFNTANTLFQFSGSTATLGSITDNVTHAVQAVHTGASSVLYVDGASNSTNPGTSVTGAAQLFMCNNLSGQICTGNVHELGLWPVAFSGGQNSSMNSNQHSYWGF